jgi:hypothetical protein
VDAFDRLIGDWDAAGEVPADPPVRLTLRTTIERLGTFVVMRSVGEPAENPDSLSVIGGAPNAAPQPMHYFDSRGVQRLYLTAIEGATWRIWRAPGEDWNGPNGPGFDQRFIGEIAPDGRTIEARWERATAPGDGWELDFPLTYVRR